MVVVCARLLQAVCDLLHAQFSHLQLQLRDPEIFASQCQFVLGGRQFCIRI